MITTDYTKTKQSALILRAVNHPFRQNILKTLDTEGEMTVSQLHKLYNCDQPVMSQALAILRRSNIVSYRRQGKEIYYRVNYDMLNKINTFTINLLG